MEAALVAIGIVGPAAIGLVGWLFKRALVDQIDSIARRMDEHEAFCATERQRHSDKLDELRQETNAVAVSVARIEGALAAKYKV